MTLAVDDLYLTDVLLLCVECRQPIKARINTTQWIRVEWIGPDGECQSCYNEKKEKRNGNEPREDDKVKGEPNEPKERATGF